MADQPYSNREIDEFHKDVRNSLTRIEMQTTATNGRVTRLEHWRFFMLGSISVLTIIVLPILAWALYTLANIQQTVHQSVDQALSAYNIQVK